MTKKEFLKNEFRPTCHDCGVKVGKKHVEGCDVQRCSACKGQRLSCDCGRNGLPDNHNPNRSKWTGYWPGVVECVKLGWFSKLIPGKGWQPTTIDDPEAVADLNRWAREQRHATEKG